MLTDADYESAWSQISASATQAGRNPNELGVHSRVAWAGDTADVVAKVETWRARSASHLAIDTMRVGLSTVDAHLGALTEIAEAIKLS